MQRTRQEQRQTARRSRRRRTSVRSNPDISPGVGASGVLNRRKFFCNKYVSRCRRYPRCRRSVARRCSILHPSRAAAAAHLRPGHRKRPSPPNTTAQQAAMSPLGRRRQQPPIRRPQHAAAGPSPPNTPTPACLGEKSGLSAQVVRSARRGSSEDGTDGPRPLGAVSVRPSGAVSGRGTPARRSRRPPPAPRLGSR